MLLQEQPATTATQTPPVEDRLVIVSAHAELESVWASYIIATAGAASGIETTIFFTFWGLLPLVRPERRVTGDNWMQRMMSLMNRGGTGHLRLSRMNFAGMGPTMMRRLARRYHVASPQELLELARDLGVRLVPCQMTLDMFGLHREDLIDGLEPPAGASAMLESARGARTFFV